MDMLSHEYPVKDICKMMGVSRSGYYKWLRREPSSREINREFMVGVVEDIHSEHPTHGYRWVAAYIRINLQLSTATISLINASNILVFSHKRDTRYITNHVR